MRRLATRRVDPLEGTVYDMDTAPPTDESVIGRLIELPDDNEAAVRSRISHYNHQLHFIEEAYKDMLFTVQADQPIEQVTEVISDVILNPIF